MKPSLIALFLALLTLNCSDDKPVITGPVTPPIKLGIYTSNLNTGISCGAKSTCESMQVLNEINFQTAYSATWKRWISSSLWCQGSFNWTSDGKRMVLSSITDQCKPLGSDLKPTGSFSSPKETPSQAMELRNLTNESFEALWPGDGQTQAKWATWKKL